MWGDVGDPIYDKTTTQPHMKEKMGNSRIAAHVYYTHKHF